MTTSLSRKQLFFLSFLIVLGAVNTCAYTPAFPAIAHFFALPLSTIQTLVVTSLIGHCLAPLSFAAFSNIRSRKSAILLGLTICLMGDICCLLAASFHIFSFLKTGIFLLSFGGNMGMSLALTVLRDNTPQKLTRSISFSMLSFSILPGLTIFIAGCLLMRFSWSSIFLSMIFYHMLLIISMRILPKTQANLPPQKMILSLAPLKEKTFLLSVGMAGMLSAFIYTFTAISPGIALGSLKLSPAAFGAWSNLPSAGMLLGNVLLLGLSEKDLPKGGLIAFTCMVLGALLLLGSHSWPLSPFIFFGAVALSFVGIQLGFPLVTANALKQATDHASQSGLFTLLQFLIASQCVNLANHLPFNQLHTMILVDIAYALVFYWLWVIQHRNGVNLNQRIAR